MAFNNRHTCPKGYVMNQNGSCVQRGGGRGRGTIGGDQTMWNPGGNTCAEQCHNYFHAQYEACNNASGNTYGYCPSYCDSNTVCTSCLDFGTGECHTCTQYITYCGSAGVGEALDNCLESCVGQGGWIGPSRERQHLWRKGGRVRRSTRRRR